MHHAPRPYSRRKFIAATGMAAAGVALASRHAVAAPPSTTLDDWLCSPAFDSYVESQIASQSVPGLSLAIITDGHLLRTHGYGNANLAQSRPMLASTLINIASVTKTVTCTAVMQLWEKGRFGLDDDVNRHLPFSVRHPAHPKTPITLRHLLTHTSSIADGPSYDLSYHCGDPSATLSAWLRSYFVPGGANYNPVQNFASQAPGALYGYSNVAVGLLGLVVECVSGTPYMTYYTNNIFTPLGMSSTRFNLAGMPPGAHATPYTYVADGNWADVPLRDPTWSPPSVNTPVQVPHCLYSFATPPDGLVRSSASDMAQFLLAYVNGGTMNNFRLLRADTVAQILSDQHVPGALDIGIDQGFLWFALDAPASQRLWEHNGGDPGVSSVMGFRPSDQRGVVILTNSSDGSAAIGAIASAIFGGQQIA